MDLDNIINPYPGPCSCKGEGGGCEQHALKVTFTVGKADEEKQTAGGWLPADGDDALARAVTPLLKGAVGTGKPVSVKAFDPDLPGEVEAELIHGFKKDEEALAFLLMSPTIIAEGLTQAYGQRWVRQGGAASQQGDLLN